MAIEPFRQRIGIAAPGSLISTGGPMLADPGPAIRSVAGTLDEAFGDKLRKDAVEAGKKAAGAVEIKRDANGNLVKPDAPKGGELFNAAFDKLVQERYLTQVNFDWQTKLNQEVNDRRVGKDGKQFDPDQFDSWVQGSLEGMLKGIDPSMRPAVEETVFREALERTRTFRDEWGRTQRAQAITGSKQQIGILQTKLANFRSEGLTWDEAYSKYGAPLDQLTERMREAKQIGPEEFDALLMENDALVDSGERYVESLSASNKYIGLIGGLDGNDLEIVANRFDGLNDTRSLSGVTVEGSAEERVTPDLIRSDFARLFPSLGKPNSVDRAADHPLSKANPGSYHNIANGGRAVDVSPIAGMTFKEYVQKWRDAGYQIVEQKEEVGKNRSAWATGDHWHVAFANKRGTTVTKEAPATADLTLENINQLDPSVRQALKGIIGDRRAELARLEAEAKAAAREAEREAKEQERLQMLISSINGANSAGAGGNWSGPQKDVLDTAFTSQVNLSNLGNPDERKKVLPFIQTNNYLPGPLVQYMENVAVSPDWRSAVELYRNVKNATLPGGGVVGDLMVNQLSARTQTLLRTADELITSGQPGSIVQARMEQLRTGNGFTVGDAVGSYNQILGNGKQGTYAAARDRLIRDTYGIPPSSAIPPALSRRIDESYTANLDIANRQPEQALQRALEQNKGVYSRSPVFFDGVGPSVLTRTYNNQTLVRFFSDLTGTDGKRALPPMKDVKGNPLPHTLGGPNSSIKLTPADNQLGSIGLYNVTIIHPQTKQVLKTIQRVDLGAALNQWSRNLPKPKPASPADPIAAARTKQQQEQKTLETIGGVGKPTFLGPKM